MCPLTLSSQYTLSSLISLMIRSSTVICSLGGENSLCSSRALLEALGLGLPDVPFFPFDEPWYYNKNVATPKDTNFSYQPGVHTNLRGIGIKCVADIFIFIV